jgi:hypothetical protein
MAAQYALALADEIVEAVNKGKPGEFCDFFVCANKVWSSEAALKSRKD